MQPLVGLQSASQSVSKSSCDHNRPSSSQSVSQSALRLSMSGTFSNDHDESKENGKKAIGLKGKTTNFARVLHVFEHFFAVTTRLRRENWPYFTLKEDVNTRGRIFLSLFKRKCGSYCSTIPKKSTAGKFASIWHFQRIGKIRDNAIEKHANSF